MITTGLASQEIVSEPSSAQLERVAALRRFNWLYVYAPISIVALAITFTIAWLLYAMLVPSADDPVSTVSAVADVFLIITSIGCILTCGLVTATAVIVVVQAKSKGIKPLQKIRQLFWKIEYGLQKLDALVINGTVGIVRIIAQIRSIYTFIQRMAVHGTTMLKWRK